VAVHAHPDDHFEYRPGVRCEFFLAEFATRWGHPNKAREIGEESSAHGRLVDPSDLGNFSSAAVEQPDQLSVLHGEREQLVYDRDEIAAPDGTLL
jgi:hypothetical protein